MYASCLSIHALISVEKMFDVSCIGIYLVEEPQVARMPKFLVCAALHS